MPRRTTGDTSGAELREHLLRLETALLCAVIGVNWPDGKGCLLDQLNAPATLPPMPSLTAAQLASPFAHAVVELTEGRAHRFRRGDLPDLHPLRATGERVHDEMELGADDVLRELVDE